MFLVLTVVAQTLLPDINEIPGHFPAVLLWQYRVAAFGIQAVMWGALGLLFASLAQPLLARR